MNNRLGSLRICFILFFTFSLFAQNGAIAFTLNSKDSSQTAAVEEPASLESARRLWAEGRFKEAPAMLADAGAKVAAGEKRAPIEKTHPTAVLVSADTEWAAVRALYPDMNYERSPFGEYFTMDIPVAGGAARSVLVFHGGWGKVSAAASTQYVVDRWDPYVLINLGTCGGFAGPVDRGTIILAERTVIYDIIERMGDANGAVADYTTALDLSWLKAEPPVEVLRTTIISADQDLDPNAIPVLKKKYGAVAADWESGAIAYVVQKNRKRLLILRGVTDLVGPMGGEAYGKIGVFKKATRSIMERLFADLPAWLKIIPAQ